MSSEVFARLKPGADAALALGVNSLGSITLLSATESQNDQIWKLRPVSLEGKDGLLFVHHSTGKALSWLEPGTKVQLTNLDAKTASDQQIWTAVSVLDTPNSNKKIVSLKEESVCLDIQGGIVAGAEIFSSTWRGGATQQWTVSELDNRSVYPAPIASHADVLTDRVLFNDTLRTFHEHMGSSLKVPSLGYKELDLHLLYREVTGRGGLAEVTRQKAWKDVVHAFSLPSTITNASFVLRKFYSTLLHHYEQVYFFGTQGPLVPPPSALPAPNPVEPNNQLGLMGSSVAANDGMDVVRQLGSGSKVETDSFYTPPEDNPVSMIGQNVTGAIHAKFEYGFIITVQAGSEKLRGILYPAPGTTRMPPPPNLSSEQAAPPEPARKKLNVRRKRRKRSEMRAKDPLAPKAHRSAYNFYFQEWRKRMKTESPELTDRECTAKIGVKWSSLSNEGRQPYHRMAEEDKERHAREILEYTQKLSVDNL